MHNLNDQLEMINGKTDFYFYHTHFSLERNLVQKYPKFLQKLHEEYKTKYPVERKSWEICKKTVILSSH